MSGKQMFFAMHSIRGFVCQRRKWVEAIRQVPDEVIAEADVPVS